MIKYSDAAEQARAFLYRDYNDIDIYVEDKTNLNAYENLVRRILPDGKKIRKIFGLTGRDSVVAHLKKNKHNQLNQPTLYIIDGDLDALTGKRKPRSKKIYRLKSYCLENLVICNEAICEVMRDFDNNLSKTQIGSKLNIPKLNDDLEKNFLPLFKMYAVCEMLGMQQLQLPTVGYSVTRMCHRVKGVLVPCRNKIAQRIRQLKYWCINKFGFDNYLIACKTVTKNVSKAADRLALISAKSYLFPILHSHCKMRCGGPGRINSFITMLSRYSDSRKLSGLKLAINNTLRP